jgi:membrane-associated phospholipid phosphatase
MDRHERYPAIVRAALVALLVLVAHLAVTALDVAAAGWMRSSPDWLLGAFRALTELGDSKWYLVPTGVAAILAWALARLGARTRRGRALLGWAAGASLFLFASVAVSGVAVNLVKMLVGRARPKLLGTGDGIALSPLTLQGDFHSFPSGHSNTAFALALALCFLLPRWRVPLLVAAALVASSRVVVTAHFVTDVVGGAAVAVLTGYWIRNLCLDRGWVLARRADGSTAPRWPGRLLPAWAWRRTRRALGRTPGGAGATAVRRAAAGRPRAGEPAE